MPLTPVAPAVPAGGPDTALSSAKGGARGGDLFSGLLDVVAAPQTGNRPGSRGDAGSRSENHGPRTTRSKDTEPARVRDAASPAAGTPSQADPDDTVKIPGSEQDVAGEAQVEESSADCDPVSTAQILAAAQVVPVAPMLAAAPTLAQLDQAGSAVAGPEAALPPAATHSPPAAPAAAPALASQGMPFRGLAEQVVGEPVVVEPAPGGPAAGERPAAVTGGTAAGAVDAELLATLTPVTSEETPAPAPATGAPVAGVETAVAAPETGQQAAGEHAPRQEGRTETLAVDKAAPAGAVTVAGPAPVASVATPAPSAAAAVTGQVFPEVARLVSRGDGIHRITLTINPEALGEVRVVLTVRHGDVSVRLAGSEIAQRALQAGAPELHRLLEQVGAGSTQIQVGDGSSTQGGQHRDGARHDNPLGSFGSQEGMSQGTERDTASNRTAGTRDGDTSARDGSARGTHPRHSTDPGTRTRLAGVDVTM